MATKERYQNPVIGDDLNLRMYTYNSNVRQDVSAIQKVEIYFLDPQEKSATNPDGRILVEELTSDDVTVVDDGFGGQYLITLNLQNEDFVIGQYLDIWTVEFRADQDIAEIENKFHIIPDLWYTGTEPIVYDFDFSFRPNRVRKGERRYLTITVTPNVPTATDLQAYYTNLAVASPLTVSIEKACGPCVPEERDLRLIVDAETIELRRGNEAFFQLDTDDLDMDCGIYNVWFEMEFGESKFISDNMQLQIF